MEEPLHYLSILDLSKLIKEKKSLPLRLQNISWVELMQSTPN
jgi:hypothetical protein